MGQRMRWMWAAVALGAWGLAGCGDEKAGGQFLEGRPYRERYLTYGETVRQDVESGACKVQQTCGDFALIDCRSELDGAAFFVYSPSWQVLEVCGGACMFGPQEGVCVACPPPEWTC